MISFFIDTEIIIVIFVLVVIKMLTKIKLNVCKAVSPLNFLAKGFGVMPYSLKIIEDKYTPTTSKKDALYTFLYIAVYALLVGHTIQVVDFKEQEHSLVPRYTIIIESAMIIVLMYTFIIFGYIFRNFVIKTLKRVCVIDDTLETIQINTDYKKMEKWIYTKIAYIIISGCVRIALMINVLDIDIIQQLLLIFTTFVKSVAKNQFVILVVQVRERYEKINDTIKSMFMNKSPNSQVYNNETIRKITKLLYVLCRVHYKLRKIVQNVITAYSIQLLAYLGVALSNIIFHSYFFYALLTSTKDKMTFYYMASSISWLIDEVFELYTLAAETATILHHLRNRIKNMELESHVQMYSLQMLHQQIQFSALGFVTVDYSLLYSILGAVTTYLIILIQFDQAQLNISNSRNQMTYNFTTPAS